MTDISVFIVFHKEAAFAIPALASMHRLVSVARESGLRIEARALLDNPDPQTLDIVKQRGAWLDALDVVSCGDLGLTRNKGVEAASGEYLAFLDGDDLWGSQWLTRAFACSRDEPAEARSIWHPESLFYFHESDYDRHSMNHLPHPLAQSFHFRHRASDEEGFDRNSLFLNNVWSANIFAHRSIYQRFPYKPVVKSMGLGIEDWTWNIETLWSDVAHRIVQDTVHIIRVKEMGSLGQSNASEGLLPHMPEQIFPIVGKHEDHPLQADGTA
ncbi:hypothetical protein BLA13014_01457 [Burkholderia aenigmatica]|uniref:Glycosyltransferase 2-like domain-containing protein n=1 Tax=Burkholderia aenigmatica TaxID=2015348 RepID=A0A6P2J2Q9_9BURK|nr:MULTISPECIES: glycosyltransferase family 2 protein [Burkholderia]VWB36017.1 hypothetical protein BLA13014_01457 [Burkholderia aenigmatica]